MRKCPKGMICFQNLATISILIILFIVGFFIYSNMKNNNSNIKNNNQNNNPNNENFKQINIINPSPLDPMDSPYSPPFRNDGYFTSIPINVPVVPINQPTNISAVNISYRQLGILTPTNQTSKDNILPLMGRPLFTSRQKFQYYTVSNQHNNVKLPISVNGKSGLDEYGVDELFDGDTIYVEGYDDVFKVTKYDNGTMRYLPLV